MFAAAPAAKSGVRVFAVRRPGGEPVAARGRLVSRVAGLAVCAGVGGIAALSAGGGAGQLAGGLGRETVRRKVAVFSLATVAHGFLRAGRRPP